MQKVVPKLDNALNVASEIEHDTLMGMISEQGSPAPLIA